MPRKKIFICSLIAIAILSACESKPTTSSSDSSISDTLNSLYQGKGIFWITRLPTNLGLTKSAYSQPDSNISNFVPTDTLKNDSINMGSGQFGETGPEYDACKPFTDTTSICGKIGDIEFVDSSLNLKEYKKITIVFSIDSSISSLKVFLDKRRPNEVLYVRKGFYQTAQDSNYISKMISTLKGSNTITFDDTSLPEGGSGYRLNFYISDSTDTFFTPTRFVCVNRARIILTK
jgi:hypothetical protein